LSSRRFIPMVDWNGHCSEPGGCYRVGSVGDRGSRGILESRFRARPRIHAGTQGRS
jgi:hypothetical protein